MGTAADYVGEATEWANALVRSESRGPGDFLPAMARVAANRVGIAYETLFKLRYRKPKTLSVEHWAALLEAFSADEQARKYFEGRPIARTQLGRVLLSAADRLAGQKAGVVSDE